MKAKTEASKNSGNSVVLLFKKVTSNQAVFVLMLLFIMWGVFALLSPHFFSSRNLTEITIQASVISIIAAGQTMVILSSGIDLGAGSVVALTAVITAMAMERTGMLIPSYLIGLVVGALCGLFNGFVIGKMKIPPFVGTLGLTMIARGIALVITNGVPQYQLVSGSDFLGQGRILGLPVPTITVFLLYFICYILLSRTRRGRYTYAIGSNAQTSFLSGINVSKQIIWVYVMAGITAAIAGITELSRIGSGQPAAGGDYALDSIAAVVLGGTSLLGGLGNIWGTLIGSLIIASLRNGLNVMNINAFWQQIVIGIILIAAVYADQLRHQIRK
jgi:ribose transport system permease protein